MKTFTVQYTVEMPEKDFERLVTQARQAGHGHGDAGPVLTAKRYLIDSGVEVIAPDVHTNPEISVTPLDGATR